MNKQPGRISKKDESKTPQRGRAPEQKVIAKVWSLAEPLCESEGLELIQVEYQRESTGRILRLYIDKPDGVKLDDCAVVSRQMSDILDVHLEKVGPYRLEITSPGPRRPLAKKHDFDRFKGRRAQIKTFQPLGGRKNFTGVLLGISGDEVSLQIDEQTFRIAYASISRARLIE